MERWKRAGFYLLLNVAVSALTTWLVLTLWVRSNPFPTVEGSPSGGQSALPEGTAAPAVGPPSGEEPPQAGGPPASGQLEITSIVGAGDLGNERVLIKHIGESELSLAGWRLADEDGNEYRFPALTMFKGGAVTVHTGVGTDTVVEMYWGLDQPVWEVGEQATLLDPEGQPQATYVIP